MSGFDTGFVPDQNDSARTGFFGAPIKGTETLSPGALFLEFFIENAAKEKEELRLIPNYFVKLRETITTDEAGVLTLELFDANWDFIENVILSSMYNIYINYGWQGEEEGTKTGLKKYVVIGYKPSFDYQGNYITLELIQFGNAALLTNKGSLTSNIWLGEGNSLPPNNLFTGGSGFSFEVTERNNLESAIIRISDVVERLADYYGIESEVERTKGFPFADREGIIQINKSPLAFIKEMAKFSISEETGATGYKLVVDGNKLIFKTASFKSKKRSYFYAREANSPVISFNPNVFNNSITLGARSSLTHTGYDPLRKETLLENFDFSKLKEGGGSVSEEPLPEGQEGPPAPNETPVPPGQQGPAGPGEEEDPKVLKELKFNSSVQKPLDVKDSNFKGRLFVTPYANTDILKAVNKAKYNEANNQIFECEIVLIGDPTLIPLDLIEINVLNNEGEFHFTSGVYTISSVEHIIDESGFITKVNAFGNSFNDIESGNAPALDTSNVVRRNQATIKRDFDTTYDREPRKEPGSNNSNNFDNSLDVPPGGIGPDARLK